MRDLSRQWVGASVLIVMSVLTLVPFVIMFLTALRPAGSAVAGFEWPTEAHWENFAKAFVDSDFVTLAGSSALIVAGVVPAALLFSTLAGYALGQLDVPAGRWIFLAFLLGLTIPFESAVVPLYYQAQDLGTLNTPLAVILPLIAWSMPFGVFWMRSQFASIPAEMSEAAQLDGASRVQVLRHVHIPLLTPALVTLGLLQFLAAWNSFLLSIVLIDNPAHRTMAGALAAFQGEHSVDIPLMCAAAVLLMAPTLALFLVLQRHFVKALLSGAVKG